MAPTFIVSHTPVRDDSKRSPDERSVIRDSVQHSWERLHSTRAQRYRLAVLPRAA
jgi:hypothetical protein